MQNLNFRGSKIDLRSKDILGLRLQFSGKALTWCVIPQLTLLRWKHMALPVCCKMFSRTLGLCPLIHTVPSS